MTAAKLPPDNHVARYVRKRLLRRDEDGNVLGVLPQAFELRDGETYLSITWLEHFSADYEQALIEVVAAIRRQLDVKPRDGFAMARVGKIFDVCGSFSSGVRVLHEPVVPENTGHCALRGIQRGELELLELLASDAFIDTRVANEIPKQA